MAYDTALHHECFCLCGFINNVSAAKIITMDFQSIITYVLLGLAVGFLIKKYFFKKKKKKNDCGNDDCGCH
ncbi:hypothetical protein GCM10007424_17900 [Flavobacterium suaedae]|uniref:FeoB-associated Cys-rich membrane protein n=1 Tax=Flavobacterium suaedae TaxID=1767027 RepID=A0ABQ1JUN0_9FLAO|nr:hypothetical protein GCM10007424_17900 [Flavobacterium suaedae]